MKVGELTAHLRLDDSQFRRAIGRIDQGIGVLGRRFDEVGRRMRFLGTRLALPLTVGAGAAVAAAVRWETAMVGVAKTVDATEAEISALGREFVRLSEKIPVSSNALANLGATAGQLGIATGNILGFVKVMAALGVSTNLAAEEAATALARLANITQMPQDEFDRLGATVVALGNNLATTEREIVEMGLRLAGAGAKVGLAESEILALAGALSSVGIRAEAGGTAISRVMIEVAASVEKGGEQLDRFASVAGMSTSEFVKLFKTDAANAIVTFIEGLGKLDAAGKSTFGVLEDLSLADIRVRDALLRASGAGDLFRRSLELGNRAWADNTALTEEAQKFYNRLGGRLTILRNKLGNVAAEIGDTLTPALDVLSGALDSLMTTVRDLNREGDFSQALKRGAEAAVRAVGTVMVAMGRAIDVVTSNPLIAQIGLIGFLFLGRKGFALGAAVGALVAEAGKNLGLIERDAIEAQRKVLQRLQAERKTVLGQMKITGIGVSTEEAEAALAGFDAMLVDLDARIQQTTRSITMLEGRGLSPVAQRVHDATAGTSAWSQALKTLGTELQGFEAAGVGAAQHVAEEIKAGAEKAATSIPIFGDLRQELARFSAAPITPQVDLTALNTAVTEFKATMRSMALEAQLQGEAFSGIEFVLEAYEKLIRDATAAGATSETQLQGMNQALADVIKSYLSLNDLLTSQGGLLATVNAALDEYKQTLADIATLQATFGAGAINAAGMSHDAFVKLIGTLKRVGFNMEGMAQLTGRSMADIQVAIDELANTTENRIRQLANDMRMVAAAAGQQLVMGIIQGVQSTKDLLKNVLMSILSAAVSFALRSALKIGSPSKIGIWAGEQVTLGVAAGIEDMASGQIAKATRAVQEAITKGLGPATIRPEIEPIVADIGKTLSTDLTLRPTDIKPAATALAKTIPTAIGRGIENAGAMFTDFAAISTSAIKDFGRTAVNIVEAVVGDIRGVPGELQAVVAGFAGISTAMADIQPPQIGLAAPDFMPAFATAPVREGIATAAAPVIVNVDLSGLPRPLTAEAQAVDAAWQRVLTTTLDAVNKRGYRFGG